MMALSVELLQRIASDIRSWNFATGLPDIRDIPFSKLYFFYIILYPH